MLNSHAVNSANVNGAYLDANVRSIVNGYAYATATPVVTVIDGTRRFIVYGYAYANATISDRVLARNVISAGYSADASPIDRAFRSNPSNPAELRFAEAIINVVPNSFSRQYHSDPLFAAVYATTTYTTRSFAREGFSSQVFAYAEPVGRSEYSPTFDEAAVPENTFVVRYEPNLFKVR